MTILLFESQTLLMLERKAEEKAEEEKRKEMEKQMLDEERLKKRQEEQDMIDNLEKMIMLKKSMSGQ